MTCSREIRWSNGDMGYTVSNYDGLAEDLLAEMIANLIKHDSDTFKPRVKWWQFWREKFHDTITNEYIKQTS